MQHLCGYHSIDLTDDIYPKEPDNHNACQDTESEWIRCFNLYIVFVRECPLVKTPTRPRDLRAAPDHRHCITGSLVHLFSDREAALSRKALTGQDDQHW